jgi:hypothetical protein
LADLYQERPEYVIVYNKAARGTLWASVSPASSLPPPPSDVELSRVRNQNWPAVTSRCSRRPTSPARCVGVAVLFLGLAACRQVAPAFGPIIPLARQNAEEFFYSVGSRFTNIQRPARIIHARSQFGHYALTPSGVYNDTTIWLAIGPDSARLFGDEGHFLYDRYIVTAKLSTTPPDVLTESREIVRLRKLTSNEYEWFTNVDVALGRIGA